MKESEIVNLINSSEGTLRINPICTLRRWTVDPLYNESVDGLMLDFDAINKIGRFAGTVKIDSRDYDGIVREVEAAINDKMQQVSDYLVNALKNGYTI